MCIDRKITNDCNFLCNRQVYDSINFLYFHLNYFNLINFYYSILIYILPTRYYKVKRCATSIIYMLYMFLIQKVDSNFKILFKKQYILVLGNYKIRHL